MSDTYPVFTNNGNSVLLFPGKYFSKKELNSRLHQMDIDYDQTSLLKKYFIDLYDNALKDKNNLLKIIDRLQKDTNQYNNKNNILNKNIDDNHKETPIKNITNKQNNFISKSQNSGNNKNQNNNSIPNNQQYYNNIDNSYLSQQEYIKHKSNLSNNTNESNISNNNINNNNLNNNIKNNQYQNQINNPNNNSINLKPLSFYFNIIQMIIASIIILIIVRHGIRYFRNINEANSESTQSISNPGKFVFNIAWELIKGIFVGIFWKYLFITIPLVVIDFFAYKYTRNYDMKATCKKIVEDIKIDLRNKPLDENGKKSISENEIITKYSKKYNIKHNTFVKKYLEELNFLREKDNLLKIIIILDNNGINKKIWFLNE